MEACTHKSLGRPFAGTELCVCQECAAIIDRNRWLELRGIGASKDRPKKTRVREMLDEWTARVPMSDGPKWSEVETFAGLIVEAVKDYLDRNFRDRQDAINNLRTEFLEPR